MRNDIPKSHGRRVARFPWTSCLIHNQCVTIHESIRASANLHVMHYGSDAHLWPTPSVAMMTTLCDGPCSYCNRPKLEVRMDRVYERRLFIIHAWSIAYSGRFITTLMGHAGMEADRLHLHDKRKSRRSAVAVTADRTAYTTYGIATDRCLQ